MLSAAGVTAPGFCDQRSEQKTQEEDDNKATTDTLP
jgi:hypothetical protein